MTHNLALGLSWAERQRREMCWASRLSDEIGQDVSPVCSLPLCVGEGLSAPSECCLVFFDEICLSQRDHEWEEDLVLGAS